MVHGAGKADRFLPLSVPRRDELEKDGICKQLDGHLLINRPDLVQWVVSLHDGQEDVHSVLIKPFYQLHHVKTVDVAISL